jgi:hypothetical protein
MRILDLPTAVSMVNRSPSIVKATSFSPRVIGGRTARERVGIAVHIVLGDG